MKETKTPITLTSETTLLNLPIYKTQENQVIFLQLHRAYHELLGSHTETCCIFTGQKNFFF
jgi:hypothetical protein